MTRAELNDATHLRHGHARRGAMSPEYRAWSEMIRRCEVPTSKHFADYGGRGIAVCRQWRRSFESFLAAVGRKPTPSHSLDRIDNAKGYKPGNVRWATREEQARNRRNNHVVHFRGQSLPVVAWAERTGIKYRTLMARLARGWSPARALEAA